MQTVNIERKEVNAQSGRFCKRIGSTLYEVNVYFNEAAKETLEDKIYRMVANEALINPVGYGNVETLQTGRLPERGSV